MKLIIEASTEDIIEIIHNLKINEIVITTPVQQEIEVPRKPSAYVEEETDQFVSQYAAMPGRRRSKLEMAKCEKEEELGRFLTPEEEGTVEAEFEDEVTRRERAKERAMSQARIKHLEQEIAADVDDEESSPFSLTTTPPEPEAEAKEESPEPVIAPKSTVPTADPLTSLNSLFA